MRLFYPLLLAVSIGCVTAHEEVTEVPVAYIFNHDIQDEEMMPRSISIDYQLSDETKALVAHRLKEVDDTGTLLTLDDNSMLEVGYWWKSRAKGWDRDDELLMVLHTRCWFYPPVEILNLTKQETVWVKYYHKRPNLHSHGVVVKKIMPKGLVALNRDLLLRLDSAHFNELYHYWSNGDQLLIFLDPNAPEGSSVRVWNVTMETLQLNVKVLGQEEANSILDQ